MSNQEAIALLRNLEDVLDSYCELNEEGKAAFRMAITALELFGNSEQLPPAQPNLQPTCNQLATEPFAQPERKTGHWEIYIISMLDGEGCRCSECGSEGVSYWDFCPSCGADMRGERNEKLG